MPEMYETLVTKSNTAIYYYKSIPAKPKAIVVISHGYGGHAGQYEHFTTILNELNYGVYALDHRGHGRSQTERGHLERFEDFIEDFAHIIDFIRLASPTVPVYTFGHSMGGLITFLYGIAYPQSIQGQIFCAAALGMPWGTNIIPTWFFRLTKKYFSKIKIYPILKRQACRDKTFQQRLRNDPFTLKYATSGFFCEFIGHGINTALRIAPKYCLPCFFLHGTGDRIIAFNYSVGMFDTVSSQDKTLKLYEELYHELLQEPEKNLVIEDIILWLEKRVKVKVY